VVEEEKFDFSEVEYSVERVRLEKIDNIESVLQAISKCGLRDSVMEVELNESVKEMLEKYGLDNANYLSD
jgi:Tfp pilus assembly PilM family ATPase